MATSIPYRREIDGLRAFAVISVVLYHANFTINEQNIVPGGFLGVDIFFVISGYLITAIIIADLDSHSFSFRNFYERRARRILPILLTVILVSSACSWFLLYPRELIEFSESALLSLVFVVNILFWLQDPYWAMESSFKPLLHTWSLSVEEQFYIVFPPLLFVLYRWRRSLVLPALIALGLGSLLLADWASSESPQFSFYMLPTRFWELGAGAVLAFIEMRFGRKPALRFPRIVLLCSGLCIILPMFLFSESTNHPSYLTAIPVIGTMALIWYLTPLDSLGSFLSKKPIVGIGLISYGLYLWHFPIFVFGKMVFVDPTTLQMLMLIVLSLIISIVTYYCIEKPFRNANLVSTRFFVAALTTVLALGILPLSLVSLLDGGAPYRHAALHQNYGEIEYDNTLLQAQSWVHLDNGPPQFQTSDRINILFFGDSHSKDTFNAFFENRHLFPQFDFSRYESWLICKPLSANVFRKFINSEVFQKAQVIAITRSAFKFLDSKKKRNCLKRVIESLQKFDKYVVVVSLHYRYNTEKKEEGIFRYLVRGKHTIVDELLQNAELPSQLVLEQKYYEYFKFSLMSYNERLQKIAEQTGAHFFDLSEIMCDHEERTCEVLTPDGKKIFYDNHHWTLAGAKYFGQKIYRSGLLDQLLSSYEEKQVYASQSPEDSPEAVEAER